MDSNFRFLDLCRAFFYTAPELGAAKGAREPQPVLTTDNGRFTVRRARLAPAMISTAGHRASRRRQREALPAWRDFLESRLELSPIKPVYNAVRAASEAGWSHAEWITLHDNPNFRGFVDFLRTELDRVSPAHADLCRDFFSRAVALEFLFRGRLYDLSFS
jgi:hypothetical protein